MGGVEVACVGTSIAGSHNATRRLPVGRYRGLCGNNFSDGTLATSTVRFWWFRKVLIFRLLQRLKNRGVEVVEKFFAYFHGVFCNGLIFRML